MKPLRQYHGALPLFQTKDNPHSHQEFHYPSNFLTMQASWQLANHGDQENFIQADGPVYVYFLSSSELFLVSDRLTFPRG